MPEKSNRTGARALLPLIAWGGMVAAIGLTVWSFASGGIAYEMLRLDLSADAKVQQLRDFFLELGVFAPLAYFVIVTVEVIVAPIPGLMLYAPGGIIFGAVTGGALALAGNVVGAGIACGVIRSLNPSWLDRFFAANQLEDVQNSLDRRGGWLIFLLRINPLTSSDVISYAAGFTRIPVWQVMLATACGMAPLCFVQAWLADNLFNAFPRLIYPLLVLCLVYVLGVVLVLFRLLRVRPSKACADKHMH